MKINRAKYSVANKRVISYQHGSCDELQNLIIPGALPQAIKI